MDNRKNEKRRSTRKNKPLNLIIILIILVVVIFFTPNIISAAKYVYNVAYDHYLASMDFYFKSDKLNIEHSEYQITNNWSGAQTHTITVNMSSKLNDMAFTYSDIDYTITVTCSDNVEVTTSKNSGTIIGTNHTEILEGHNQDSFSIYVNPKNGVALQNTETAWVDVCAKAVSPYEQYIYGKLIIEVGSSSIYYEIVDSVNSPYLTVNIVNSSAQASNVTLSYNPQQVLLDMTNRFYINNATSTDTPINGYDYLNSITANVPSLSTTSVKFYKVDASQNYSYSPTDTNVTPIITLSH